MKKGFYKSGKAKKDNYKVHWEIYPKILKLINLKKGRKILDAGCGNGELGKYLKGFDLYGFDPEKKAIREASKKNYKKLFLAGIYKTNFKSKEFNVSFCIQVFPYISKQEEAFFELIRITKDKIILSVPNFNWLKLKSIINPKYKKNYNLEIEEYSFPTNSFLLKKFAKKNNLQLKIFYLSNKFGFIRNIFGNWLASEVVGIYTLK